MAVAKGRRRSWLAVVLAAAVISLVWGSLASGNSPPPSRTSASHLAGAAATGRVTTAGLPRFKSALISRLQQENLTFHWVVCVPSGGRFKDVRVVRCNVDFGEPHIEAYCSVFSNGRLLTSQEDPAIPCGHDNAGWSDPIVQYG